MPARQPVRKHAKPPARTIVDGDGSHAAVDKALVAQHLERDEYFWLDIDRPDADDVAMLRELFHFHEIALADSAEFGQRPKLDPYEGYIFLVFYGANEDKDGLVEVHCFASGKWLVTIHRDDCPAFESFREYADREGIVGARGPLLLYHVLDSLVDSFLAQLALLDERIDVLEDGVLDKPDRDVLQSVLDVKRRLVMWRRVVTPQRDLFERLVVGIVTIPGVDQKAVQPYYRDLYDHLIRISETIDSYRDLLSGLMGVYASAVSNRMNEIMKRLTIAATVFLPLMFVTSFFGQNFLWMTDRIRSAPMFWLLDIVVMAVAVGATFVWMKWRGWM
jgi:magnesium transporter